MSAITKRTFVAGDPTQALQMTQLAIKHATSGEPGPVAVIFHGRSLFERLDPAVQPPAYLDRSYASPAAPAAADSEIDSAVDLLRSASRPVIVSGNGVRLARAEDRLLAFARAIGAPVATTPAGKGTFPETDELAAGVIGSFGHDTANAVVGNADLVIAVGTKLGATDTANAHPALINARRQKIIQLDVEPLNLSWTYPADVMVLGDAAGTLARLRAQSSGYTTDGSHRVAAARAEHGFFGLPFSSEPGKLSGRDVVRILSEELADEAVVTCDAGENRLFVLRDFQAKPGGTVLQPNGGGGMAYAIPVAMAAAVNFPDRPAVAGVRRRRLLDVPAFTGVRRGARVSLTVVVLDNNVLGWVYNGQRGRVIASELGNFDYAAVASAIGAFARSVDTLDAAREAIRDAQGRPGVSVVVAKTTKDDRYQDIMSALNPHDVYAVPE